jgi:hypothetical protein
MVADQVNVYLLRDGFHLFFPMRGKDHWRIVGILPSELRNRKDVGFDAVVPSLRHEAGDALVLRRCSWFSTYRIHHRRAARFRDRRCFLLGDAAHIHSPVGAQGMNTGLQDAYNLAWKLALVVQGRADPALLGSYPEEREPVAERLLATTDRAFAGVVSGGRLAQILRTQLLPRALAFAMRRRFVRRFAFRMISQTGIRYRQSPLSLAAPGLGAEGPQPGDRFPWLHLRLAPGGAVEDLYAHRDDTRFALLLFGQPAPAALAVPCAALIDVHAFPDDHDNRVALAAAGIPHRAFYLLRPDGHVGFAGRELDVAALSAYLSGCVRLLDGM